MSPCVVSNSQAGLLTRPAGPWVMWPGAAGPCSSGSRCFMGRTDGEHPKHRLETGHTLIEIRASENIGLTAPMTELRECGLTLVMERPKPPLPPGTRLSRPHIFNNLTGLSGMALPDFDVARHLQDQEDFEYASDVKLEIEPLVVLTCGLWRHSLEPRELTVRLVPEKFDSPIKGQITCTVHADNLTKPAMFKLIVTLSPDYRPALEPAFGWFTTPHPDE